MNFIIKMYNVMGGLEKAIAVAASPTCWGRYVEFGCKNLRNDL